jgi:hypothetical protein
MNAWLLYLDWNLVFQNAKEDRLEKQPVRNDWLFCYGQMTKLIRQQNRY